jgi:hypothetical protein
MLDLAGNIVRDKCFRLFRFFISDEESKNLSYWRQVVSRKELRHLQSGKGRVLPVLPRGREEGDSEILSRNVAAFSYFYDRALDNGILLPGQVEVSYNSFPA